MIIYADVLFAVNFIMDYITLCVCSRVLSLKPVRIRMILSALAGGLYCAAGLYMHFPEPFTAVVMSFAMCLICFGKTGKLLFAKIILLFYAVGMLFGGIITFFYNVFYKYRNTYLFKDGLTLGTFLLFAVLALIFMFAVSKLFAVFASKKPVTLKLEDKGNIYCFKLLCDSGNLLLDPYSGLPVVIIKAKCLDRVFGKDGVHINPESNTDDAMKYRLRFITVKTVAGSAVMPGFHIDSLSTVTSSGKKKRIAAVIASDSISDADYGGFDGVIPYTLCE